MDQQQTLTDGQAIGFVLALLAVTTILPAVIVVAVEFFT